MYLKFLNKFYLTQFVITILFFLSSSILPAQSNQLFRNVKTEYGIASNSVNSMTQDKNGFIWLATSGGLFRYDGYELTPFKNDRSSEENHSQGLLNVIVNDNENKLWAGSQSGLLFFDTSTGKNIKIDLGGNRDIRCLLKQGDSILWAGSNEGLFKINTTNNSFELFNQKKSKLSSNTIRSLYLSKSNEFWVGTFDGLNRLKSNGKFESYDLKKKYKPELENNLILDIQPYSKTSDSLLWVGTETGLVLFNTETKDYDVYNAQNTKILNEVVKCVYSKIPGEVYFGTDLGLYKYNVNSKEVSSSFHDPFNHYSIANNIVTDIFEDTSGFLWLSTHNGVSKLNYNQNKFQFTPVYSKYKSHIVGTQINNIYKDNNIDIWLATTHGVKVLKADGSTQEFTTKNDANSRIVLNSVVAITGDALGRIWIGSAGGINIWDPKSEKMFTITATFDKVKGLRTNYISSFIQPDDGSFWVTTWGGGIYKAQGDFSNLNDVSFRFMADFNSGMFSANKKIWLLENHKVYALDVLTNEIETFESLNKEIEKLSISALHVSKRGDLWIGSTNMLVKYQIQSNHIEKFPINTGKSSLPYNLVEDHSGNIWGTTLTSIFKFNIINNTFEVYPKTTGIALDNFVQGGQTVGQDGQLFFGGNDGFISFYPDDIKKSTFKPKLLITNLSIRGKDINSLNEIGKKNKTSKQISFYDEIVLDHDQNSIKLQFSSLHLEEPLRNIYGYKLEGYDDDWLYTTGDSNYASYSNVPTGDYTFYVKGTNNDGVWFDDEIALNISIKPPFWASYYALSFYFLILFGAVVLLKNTYINKIKWKEEIKLIKVEKEKNEEIALSKQRLFTNVSHEFLTPLTLILGPIDNLMRHSQLNQSDSLLVSLVQKNAQRLLSLINQLLDLRKIETNSLKLKFERFDAIDLCQKQYELFMDLAENKQIKYRFEASNQSVIYEGDKIRFESIVQNLLSNAFKYTPAHGEIEFIVELIDQSVIKILVKDSGIGISKENRDQIFKRFYQDEANSKKISGYGIGLNIIKEYCELMKGKIWFESEPDMGASFFVELPIQIIEAIEKPIEIVTEHTTVDKDLAKKNIPNSNLSLPTLLLVDDHADTLNYLQLSLKEQYAILIAKNGKIAFEILKHNKVDLIVSDVMMDEMEGIEFCKKVKQQPKYEGIPIILLTAKTMDSQKVEGFRAGADAYMTKPFNMDILKIRIENFVGKKQKIQDQVKRKLILGNQEVEVKSADEKLLQETIQYINKHMTNTEINLENMARSIGVSYSSLFRKIKAQTGLRLNELVRDIRLKKAENLLKTGKLTISEVIYETGFSSHSYFAKCFKKEYKVSPKEYLQAKN